MKRFNNWGWVILYRQIMNNPIYFEEPFCKALAWIDLIMLANHADNGKYKRGHVYTSKIWLADRWQWDRRKVTTFLKELEEERMIVLISVSKKGIILKILNYDKFQMRTTECTTNGTTKCTTNRTYLSPTESKDSEISRTTKCTTDCTTENDQTCTTNNKLLTNNNCKEIQIKNTLSLMERRGIQKDKLSPDAKEVYEKISKGEEVDFSKYEDEDGAMDANIMHIMSVLEEI